MRCADHALEYRKLADIKPYQKNPRKNDKAVTAVANSIREYGFQSPIIVDRDGVIIAGHTRYKAAKRLRLSTVPVIVAAELTPEQAKELRVPYELVRYVHNNGRLPVVNFAAGGVATPADAALMMQLGAEGVFVGSGIFKSGNPKKRAAAIVKAVTNYQDAAMLAELSEDLGEAMVGINEQEIELLMAERGK